MGCTEGLARILVFVANFLFLLVGLALLVVGILYKVNFTQYTQAIPDDYDVVEYVPTIAIVVGAIIFLIAFLGCCGALRSSTCMLTSYGAILFIIFLAQVALGIFALVTIRNTDDLRTKLDKGVSDLFGQYYNPNRPDSVKEAVDIIQKSLNCCGTTGRASWNTHPVPASCPAKATDGCQQALYDFVMHSINLIGIVALAVSIVEVVGAILALCLSNCIRSRERQGAYY